MEEMNLKNRTLSGMLWKLLEKLGSQGMQLVIQIVLARLLLPEEYGLIGLLTIFIAISDVFILQGFTTALIQKKDADQIDLSTVFFANLIMSEIIYFILFFIAPAVSEFYHEPMLTKIMRVLSLNVVIGAISAVHNAVLSKELDFQKSFFRNIANTLTQGVVGISLAMLNFGAWSMVFARLAGVSVGVIVLWSTVRWRPTLTFSLNRLKALFSFSSKVLFTNLMNTLFNNMHSLIIGRYYTAADLGYYQRGQQFPQAAMAAVDGSMSEVLYPAFSRVQNDVGLLKRAVRRSIKTSMYIVLPILFGLMVTAHNLTLVLLTEKWLPSVPFMQLACIICMFWPLSHRSHALNAMGLSDVTLKLSLIGKCTTLVCILLFVRMGIFAIMFGTIVASVISFGVTTFYINKYLHYSLRELAVDVLPSLLGAAGMSVVVVIVGRMIDSPIVALIIQIIIGGGMYLMFSIIMNNESFNYIWLIIKPHIEKIFHYKRAQH